MIFSSTIEAISSFFAKKEFITDFAINHYYHLKEDHLSNKSVNLLFDFPYPVYKK